MKTVDVAARELAIAYVAWRNAQQTFRAECFPRDAGEQGKVSKADVRKHHSAVRAAAAELAKAEDAFRKAQGLAA